MISTLVRRAVQVEYLLVRISLMAFERQVISRVDENSMLSSSFRRGVGLLDAVAARWLDEPKPTPDTHSATARVQAVPLREVDDAALPPEAQHQVEQLTDELRGEQEEKRLAGELAEDDEMRRVQTALRARHLVEEGAQEPPHLPG